MATQAEIEAAGEALRTECRAIFGSDWNYDVAWRFARAALEAAERVRPRETSTERTRRHRAKKRAAGNAPAAGNVPDAGGDVSPRAGPDPDLLARLTEAAGGNVAPGAVDVAPIQVLLAQAAISTSTSCRSSARSQRAQCRSSGGTSHG